MTFSPDPKIAHFCCGSTFCGGSRSRLELWEETPNKKKRKKKKNRKALATFFLVKLIIKG